MRIFLDANVLFSAARSNGAVRQLLQALQLAGHVLVADDYVATEARRNLAIKAPSAATDALAQVMSMVEVCSVAYQRQGDEAVLWLPTKDKPVLVAAMALRCEALVTGDRTHFGPGYGKVFGGVAIYSPAQLAQTVFPAQRPTP